MHGLKASLGEIRALGRALADEPTQGHVLVCPPATLIVEAVKAAEGSSIAIGGQDCHAQASGAFTGDISAEMLRDAGATSVILGHSERRQFHGETSAIVAAKAKGARRAGLHPIVCVGETEGERTSGRAIDVVTRQLENSLVADTECDDLAVAYEPV